MFLYLYLIIKLNLINIFFRNYLIISLSFNLNFTNYIYIIYLNFINHNFINHNFINHNFIYIINLNSIYIIYLNSIYIELR